MRVLIIFTIQTGTRVGLLEQRIYQCYYFEPLFLSGFVIMDNARLNKIKLEYCDVKAT